MAPSLLNFDVTLGELSAADVRLVAFRAEEAISRCWSLDLQAETGASVDPEALVGQAGEVRILRGDAPVRTFRGVVRQVRVRGVREGLVALQVQLAPTLALLDLGRDHRLFRDLSASDAVKKVLGDAGIAADAQQWTLSVTPQVREIVFQQGESDLVLIERLLSEEGIGYALHDDEGEERLLFFDDSAKVKEIPGDPLLPMAWSAPEVDDAVTALRERRRLAPDAVMVKDYDFKRPRLDISGKATAPEGGSREVYWHPGEVAEASAAKSRATRLLEERRVFTRTVEGESACPRLRPASRFTVEGHRRAALNGEYLLVSVTHEMSVGRGEEPGAASYTNTFTAIPSEVPYRPTLRQAPVRAPGVAFVTVPGGEDIHADPFGRVKVRFPWDRSGITDDRSSAWLRVGQVPLQGSVVLPRNGFEVGVHYENGSPDRPFVTGHFYNQESLPPYELPGAKTRSALQSATSGGSGSNELRFEDSAGAEEMFFNASKDFIVEVVNDSRLAVGNNASQKVDANVASRVGANLTAVVGGARKLDVGGAQSVDVGKDLTESTGGDEKHAVSGLHKVKVGGDWVESVKGTFARKVGGLQAITAIKGYTRKVVGDSKTLVGAAWLEVIGGSRETKVTGNRFETIGAIKRVKAKQLSVTVEKALAISAGVSDVKCGGARSDSSKGPMALTASAGLAVKASTVSFTAESSLTFIAGPCTIKMSSGGEVKISAPTVELSGAKALSQLDHKSN